ncbi:LeoA/HP0731 family dynamin-like GTPase [Pantoea cypripedii]|uniref:GTP-binding protein n=1 Tax=Pantoea cypripedii TaxID=55209 RepID=A0A6B9G4Q9_PANCY|nr:LeoA/HP0731 family dynamin-like GTPase [Pantoea cypripedii]QGY32661.1 GTP-binding protein [Pantoea cypripedii]
MDALTQFSIEKQRAIAALDELRDVVQSLGELEIDVAQDLEKIHAAMQAVESDVLSIALLGAFSDGKTSVIAAWLGRIMDDMAISMDESSNQVAVYQPEGLPGKCEIIDTPGLFGDKEREIDGRQVMYEDLTKQYISQAHLILYVVDATNPLKESHSAIVRWLLRDLNKLSSTIFVINKMDEVTDLTEQSLFEQQETIKKANLRDKLARMADLSADELAQLYIVCVASNPNGRGLEFWFGKPEQYDSRSRIPHLKQVTGEILASTVPAELQAKTGLDVVHDIIRQRVIHAQQQLEALAVFARQNNEESVRFSEDIRQSRREVKQLARDLQTHLLGMEKQLMGMLRPLSAEDIRSFMEDELGLAADGIGFKLSMNIKSVIDSYFDQSSSITQRLSDNIIRQVDSSASFLGTLSEGAIKSLGGTFKTLSKIDPDTIKSTIFLARDTVGKVTGYVYKFQPWEATKLAGGIARWAGPAGAAIQIGTDLYGMWAAHAREEELREAKTSLTQLIQEAFKEIYDILADDEKMFAFFAPQIVNMEKVVNDLQQTSVTITQNQEKLGILHQKLVDMKALPVN